MVLERLYYPLCQVSSVVAGGTNSCVIRFSLMRSMKAVDASLSSLGCLSPRFSVRILFTNLLVRRYHFTFRFVLHWLTEDVVCVNVYCNHYVPVAAL
jgi:hypothetical protein